MALGLAAGLEDSASPTDGASGSHVHVHQQIVILFFFLCLVSGAASVAPGLSYQVEIRSLFGRGWAEGYTSAEYVAQLPTNARRKKMPPRPARE